MKKMKDILSEAFEDTPTVNKHSVIEGVRNFSVVGKSLYNNGNIMEVANQLADIAESAHSHILGEQDDWFDKISVNKNMKSLKTGVVEFQKTAKEAHSHNQRLTSLYEDIGHVLNRYYEIDEVIDEKLDSVDTSKVEPHDDFEDREDQDIDNDGEVDDEDAYIHNKRQNITKAVKKETKEAPGELDNNDDEKIKEPHGSQYDDHSVKEDKAIKKAMKETTVNKPTKRLKDVGNIATGIPALGDLLRKR